MDNRYSERGYSTSLKETEYGAFLEVFRNETRIGEVSLCIVGGPAAPVHVVVKRYVQNELRNVTLIDDF